MFDVTEVQQFHGHMCPGLATGIRVAEIALREIGPHSSDEEIVAIVETDMCGVDAIQYLTGCTFGKGNLIHLDHGKNVFTFIRRSDGKAIRIVTRPNDQGKLSPEHQELFTLVIEQQATSEQQAQFQALHIERAQSILQAPEESLFTVQNVEPHIPQRARVYQSVQCEQCGEMCMETRVRLLGGRKLCIPCFQAEERKL